MLMHKYSGIWKKNYFYLPYYSVEMLQGLLIVGYNVIHSSDCEYQYQWSILKGICIIRSTNVSTFFFFKVYFDWRLKKNILFAFFSSILLMLYRSIIYTYSLGQQERYHREPIYDKMYSSSFLSSWKSDPEPGSISRLFPINLKESKESAGFSIPIWQYHLFVVLGNNIRTAWKTSCSIPLVSFYIYIYLYIPVPITGPIKVVQYLNLSIKKTRCSELQSNLVGFDLGKNINLTKKQTSNVKPCTNLNFFKPQIWCRISKIHRFICFGSRLLDNYRTYYIPIWRYLKEI